MAERLDARPLNWRFVVPSEPEGLLLLAMDGERIAGAVVPDRTPGALREALDGASFPAVAVPDVGSWSGVMGSSAALLRKRSSDGTRSISRSKTSWAASSSPRLVWICARRSS